MANNHILILNGPGLADLTDAADAMTLAGIEKACAALCGELQLTLDCRQSDDQAQIADWIANDGPDAGALLLNPASAARAAATDPEPYCAALGSVAAHDTAICEVHLTNIFQGAATHTGPLHVPGIQMGLICGLGVQGYLLAIEALQRQLAQQRDAH